MFFYIYGMDHSMILLIMVIEYSLLVGNDYEHIMGLLILRLAPARIHLQQETDLILICLQKVAIALRRSARRIFHTTWDPGR